MAFVHLHCHSAYSLGEGTAKPQTLVSRARQLNMQALALTDRGNFYGLVPFYLHAQKAGIKPVIGMVVDLDDGSSLTLLARNMDGYRNLCHLSSVLRLTADPEVFSPAGFDADNDGDEEIMPWDPGLWGVQVFGFAAGNRSSPVLPRRKAPSKAARLPRELLLSGRHARGLVALSGGRRGLVNSLVMQGKEERAAHAAGMLLSAFGEGNFFIELQCLGERDAEAMPVLAGLADRLGIPIVATNDVLYLNPEDFGTAMALTVARKGRGAFQAQPLKAVQGEAGQISLQGCTDLQEEVGTERYFKSAEQMASLFHQYPQAFANTRFIAEQCTVELPLGKALFPSVDLKEETPYSRLWKLCFAGATRCYRVLTEAVMSRLKHELGIIESLGFSAYFLVVHDIVRFAHSHNIPIMARGSAADSLVAYVLGITQVDPLEHDLLFERFLNTSRAEFELPDIDLDLCWRRRDEVLHYVYERYGRDHVAIVGTHITFRLRSAWREMAKALGISPQRIGYIAARLPDLTSAEDILTGDEELAEESELEKGELIDISDIEEAGAWRAGEKAPIKKPRFRSSTEQAAFELCQAVEGLPRHMGMHCAGVVISPASTPIADLVPLQRAARDHSMAITQYDKDAIESMGLVKMDLLGSRALTTLFDTIQASGLDRGMDKGSGDVTAALEAIPLDDELTYRMMAEGNTLGCFQLESPGMRGLLKWLQPRNLDDVAASVSLFRPGPLEGGFLETFMRRHLGQEPVSFPHPSMEPILKSTYGVILYQEQFLQVAHLLAGLDLGEAEKLRKAIGKARSPEERSALGREFVAGAIERGIDQMQAERVWEVVSGYTGFGFCRGHACSYALTAYRCAYMKAHYPAHYIAALLNNQGGYYGPTVYVEDARRLGISVLPPHVNRSNAWCEAAEPSALLESLTDAQPQGKGTSAQKGRSIRLGLHFIKGLSERAIALILSERRAGGPFRSLAELLTRVEMSLPEASALVKVGACDGPGLEINTGGWGSTSAASGPSIPSISEVAATYGELGEPLGTIHVPPLNRRQMAWVLPAIFASRRAAHRTTTRTLYRRDHAEAHRTEADAESLQATGSDGLKASPQPGMQMLIGEMAGQQAGLRILGEGQVRIEVPLLNDYTQAEKLQLEKDVLGFTASMSDMQIYRDAWRSLDVVLGKELLRHAGREVRVAGTIVAGRRHMGKNGEWMLFLTLQNAGGLIEVVLFSDAYMKSREVIASAGDGPYLITGHVQVSGKGRGAGAQVPDGLRPTDTVTIKMHPVIVARQVQVLAV